MAKRCVFGCLPNTTLFSVPRPPWLRSRWREFLHFEEEGLTVNSRLCSRHFTPECFQNLTQHQMGFAKVLYLKNTAVPSVYTVGASQSMKVGVSRWLDYFNNQCIPHVFAFIFYYSMVCLNTRFWLAASVTGLNCHCYDLRCVQWWDRPLELLLMESLLAWKCRYWMEQRESTTMRFWETFGDFSTSPQRAQRGLSKYHNDNISE